MSDFKKKILIGTSSGFIYLVDITEETIKQKIELHRSQINSIVMTSDQSFLSSSIDGIVYEHNLTGSTLLDETSEIAFIAHNKNTKLDIFACHDGCLKTLIEDYNYKRRFLSSSPSAFAANNDATFIVLGDSHGDISIVNFEEIRSYYIKEAHENAVYGLAVFPDNSRFASASRDGSIAVWDINTRRLVNRFQLKDNNPSFYSVAVTKEMDYVIGVSRDNSAYMWSLKTGVLVTKFCHESPVRVVIAPTSQEIITGDNDGNVYLWSLGSGALIKKIRCGTDNIVAMTIIEY
jgi:WD40 repeat protein